MKNLGVIIMELLAFNPYRILGLPVNTSASKANEIYKNLLSMCDNGTIQNYTTPFDLPSLPPFQRNTESLESAFTKLDGDVYKCFAFAESLYATNLSHADIIIQINNMDSYDKFLSCYIWLIINDKNLTYKNLWFKVAKHIDMLSCSGPDDWNSYFDHRFPDDVYISDFDQVKAFYNTFAEVILLPMKELVKGSMECFTASEILSIAMFDGDIGAFFEEIETAEKQTKRLLKKAPEMPSFISAEEAMANTAAAEISASTNAIDGNERAINLVESASEENIYNDALKQMILSNRAKNQEIRSVDTSVVYGGGNLSQEQDIELLMDIVNAKTMDMSRLNSPYEIVQKEEKHKDIDISDMLNPKIELTVEQLASKRSESSRDNAMIEVEEAKLRRRNKNFLKFMIFIMVVGVITTVGIVFGSDIVAFVKDLLK